MSNNIQTQQPRRYNLKQKAFKYFAVFTLAALVNQILFPVAAWALTGGPSQPEVQQFQQVGSGDLVDLFTGDFNYSIPLLDVGGYPIGLSYRSGVQSDQEASWVGLGWNLDIGAIVRNMRGIPDEFDGARGDRIVQKRYVAPDISFGLSLGPRFEWLGKEIEATDRGEGQLFNNVPTLDASVGLSYNSYRGLGIDWTVEPGLQSIKYAENQYNVGLGISGSSQDGTSVRPTVNFAKKMKGKIKFDLKPGLSTSIHSRSGMKAISVNAGLGVKNGRFGVKSNDHNFNFASPGYVPQTEFPLGS
ncbi:MAG: hypothetical protein AAF570_18985, partial [Bacteroidota bacterium]